MKKNVGFIGWRGIVGSVLINRMIKENNFMDINPIFFSTSQVGKKNPFINGIYDGILHDAYNINILKKMDIILTCQGTDYTDIIYPKLRNIKWNGYWIDASASLRMNKESVIVLDPVNIDLIKLAIHKGIKTFVGSNCTVSLMLMSLKGLFLNKLIKWIYFSTYQAASGAGSKHILELLKQMGYIYNFTCNELHDSSYSVLDIEKKIVSAVYDLNFPKINFVTALAGNVLPWIDKKMDNGQTKEEWKVQSETNKILNLNSIVAIDGTCVRVGTFRCHSQSFLIKLNKNISCENIIEIITKNNKWIKIIPNDYDSSINFLTPMSVSGKLNISVGRIRKSNIESNLFSIFSVGDQLLWGAAEPLRRMLMILINN